MFLLETKNLDSFVLSELQDLCYDSHNLVSPHGHGRGCLALLWNNCIDIQIISACHNYIDTVDIVKGQSFNCIFTYGAPDVSLRKNVWKALTTIISTRPSYWFLAEDLNEITENSEKLRGPEI